MQKHQPADWPALMNGCPLSLSTSFTPGPAQGPLASFPRRTLVSSMNNPMHEAGTTWLPAALLFTTITPATAVGASRCSSLARSAPAHARCTSSRHAWGETCSLTISRESRSCASWRRRACFEESRDRNSWSRRSARRRSAQVGHRNFVRPVRDME